jgi:hypothetical protein
LFNLFNNTPQPAAIQQQPIGDLSRHFTAQQQLSDQSTQTMLAQALGMQKGSNLGNQFSRGLGGIRAQVPQFEQVQARGIGEGLLRAIPAGLNNAMQLGAYRREQDSQKQMIDLAMQKDLAAAQQKQQMLDLGNANIRALYPNLAPEQLAALQAVNSVSGGEFFTEQGGNFGKQQMDLSGIVPQATAEAQGKVAGLDVLGQEMQGTPLTVKGIPQQDAVNRYQQLYGTAPQTDLSIQGDVLDVATKDENLTAKKFDNRYKPVQQQQETTLNALQITQQQVKTKYAEVLAEIDRLTGEGKLEEAQQAKALADEGKALWDTLVSQYDTLTDGEIKMANSKFKALDTPFELPERNTRKLTAVSKDGSVKQFYDEQGNIYPVIKNK